MLIGYARISKNNGDQNLDLQIDALKEFGINEEYIYTDQSSGADANREGLYACLKSLRENDTLVVWRLDRLGRNLKNLIDIVEDLDKRKVGFKVLSGYGSNIDTTTSQGKLMFRMFSIMAEYERDVTRERTMAGIQAARARGRIGGRKFKLNPTKLYLMQGALQNPNTEITKLCQEMGVTTRTLYNYLSSEGEFRARAIKVINKDKKKAS